MHTELTLTKEDVEKLGDNFWGVCKALETIDVIIKVKPSHIPENPAFWANKDKEWGIVGEGKVKNEVIDGGVLSRSEVTSFIMDRVTGRLGTFPELQIREVCETSGANPKNMTFSIDFRDKSK